MQRRTLLKALGAGAWTGAGLALGGVGRLLQAGEAAGPPALAAVKNGEPEALFDNGIQALGGMGRFVKKGQTVVVKPNIGW
ncbi:MAG: tat (twin-arginine translocation) pathway signal sequence, partial [Candidatus Contendobacter sp.]|nr:tat (twin-arginine translocation) pathway signal sequence [Candidatus Contendobacter sp.]